MFSTGRTGTGYLSQLFGSKEYSKIAVHLNNDIVVTYEGFRNIKHFVSFLKKTGYNEESKKEALKTIYQLFSNIKEEYKVERLFITDHRIGRMFFVGSTKYRYRYKDYKNKPFKKRCCKLSL